MPLEPGHLIGGKYRVEALLGAGGGGAVYVALNLALRKRVALKVLHELHASPSAARRLVLEAIAASRVRHRAIVEVFDAGEHEGSPWLAMELLTGETLSARLRRPPPLTAAEVVGVARELARGLAAAHDAGVVHRDLKPDNVFLATTSGGGVQPKLLDFGLARVQRDDADTLTQEGAVLGTLRYMSPEQAAGEGAVDGRSDLFALGVILFEALAGEGPHAGATIAARLASLARGPARDLRPLAPHAPEALVRLIEDCLATDPRARPLDAHDLDARLEASLAGARPRSASEGARAAVEMPDGAALPPDTPALPSPASTFIGRMGSSPSSASASRRARAS